MLITSCDPLTIFLHRNGLVRFATEPYQSVTSSNKTNSFIHLTNYAINKNNSGFRNSAAHHENKEDRSSHKRSIKDFFKELERDFKINTAAIWEEIESIVVKTVCAIQPNLRQAYKVHFPEDPYNQSCFELLGLDVILTEKLKPVLLEVNHSPSFSTDSPVDLKVKRQVISDTFRIIDSNKTRKLRLMRLEKQKAKIQLVPDKQKKIEEVFRVTDYLKELSEF